MLEAAHKRYCATYTALDTDEEYLALKARLQEHEPHFLAVMESLSQQQRDIITEHIGICGELYTRIVEVACFLP